MSNFTSVHKDSIIYEGTDDDVIMSTCGGEQGSDVFYVITLICAIAGVILNFFVIYLITVLREYKKSVTNIYVLQLAIADFAFTLTFVLRDSRSQRFQPTDVSCKIVEAVRMVSYYTSVIFLAVMSLDRHLAVNHALSTLTAKLRTNEAATRCSAIVWLGCFLCAFPFAWYSKATECTCYIDFHAEAETSSNPNTTTDDVEIPMEELLEQLEKLKLMEQMCSHWDNTGMKLVSVVNFVVFFVLPLAVTIFCYIKILHKINNMSNMGSNQSESAVKRKRVTNMVIAMVTTFMACWLPYHCYMLGKVPGMKLGTWWCEKLREVVALLAFSNSTLNPMLYTFLGTSFRGRCTEVVSQITSTCRCVRICRPKPKRYCAPNKSRTTQMTAL